MDRTPSQSIELLLDADADARIREDWRRLQAAGLSSLGAHTAPSNAPHVTLVAAPRVEPPPAATWSRLPLTVRLGGLLLLGTGERRVLARAIVPTAELLRLHERMHERVLDADPRTAPGAWTPHLTLARRLRAAQLPEALAALGDEAPSARGGDERDGAADGAASARSNGASVLLVAARHWQPTTRTITAL